MGGHFDLDSKKNQIATLEKALSDQNIWNDPANANKLNGELVNLQKEISLYQKTVNEVEENIELINLLDEQDLNKLALNEILETIEELEINTLLSEKFDSLNCFLEIHPGAGGTEACDWAEMLYRMYEMFCSKNNYRFEIIDLQKGEEAGLKNILVKISGFYPYGYFKSEQGIHRLVRISPFDSNSRRHTSFAAVSVIPEIIRNTNITINPDDLKIDVYRSSGKGGQGVNTTDSAVRITHIPTNIVVTCQNERSQLRNKEVAMSILQGKLEQKALESQSQSLNSLKNFQNIEFGSQIRNYTLEPYKLVKDLRSNYETSNTDDVLNGNIKPFMTAYLRIKR